MNEVHRYSVGSGRLLRRIMLNSILVDANSKSKQVTMTENSKEKLKIIRTALLF
jgi:hypothetical protein